MNAGDDLLADVTTLVVGDQAIDAEFGDYGYFIHINTVSGGAVFDAEGFVEVVCDSN